MDSTIKLPRKLRDEFLAALQVVRPGSVEEELTEKVCIALLRDRTNPNERHVQSTGGTGRPSTAGNSVPGGVSENEWKLMQRAKALEDELRLALCAAEDIRALKHKASLLMEDVRKGKEELQAQVTRSKSAIKERDMLMDHAEKLMKVIRQLSIDKLKIEEKRREERQLVFQLTQDNIIKDNKIASKRRAIKTLVDTNERMSKQMQLMDEKFVDLRMRFDAAKRAQNSTLDKAIQEAHTLRKKFNVMTHGRGRLEDVPLPSEYPLMAPHSTTLLQTGEQWMDASQGFFPKPSGATGNQGKDRLNTPNATTTTNNNNNQRPATTGGIGRTKAIRPGTAPGSPAYTGARKRGGHGSPTSTPAVPEDEDIDKIIEKIYTKQKRSGGKDQMVWTPKKLASLVMDSSGRLGCAIPDITGGDEQVGRRTAQGEPVYSKLPSR